MRIENKTHWRSDQLRALILRVAKDELQPGQLKRARVKIQYRRSNSYRLGCAHAGQSERVPRIHMWLNLERDKAPDPKRLARTIAHEFAHGKGLHHRDMKSNARLGMLYLGGEGWEQHYSYAENFPIEATPPKKKPTQIERLEAKLAHSEKMLKLAATRLKRAKTLHKKWSRRLSIQTKAVAALIEAESESEPDPFEEAMQEWPDPLV
jgi:hypothetical protein